MPTYTYKISGGIKHTWTVDNIIESANANNELIFSKELRRKQRYILDMMKILLKLTQERGITIFAIGGTELGAVRNQGLIAYDDDGDFGFRMSELNKLIQLSKDYHDDIYELIYINGDIGFRMRNKGKYVTHIDLFLMDIDKNKEKIVHISPIIDNKPHYYAQYIYPNDWIEVSNIDNLIWVPFEDFKIPIPSNSDVHLKRLYSENCLTTFVADNRSMFGMNVHDYMMNIYEQLLGRYIHVYNMLPTETSNNRKGHSRLLMLLITMEITNLHFETDYVSRMKRIKQLIFDYMKYK
jgi:phosphorylcholine metabolism protein LicD